MAQGISILRAPMGLHTESARVGAFTLAALLVLTGCAAELVPNPGPDADIEDPATPIGESIETGRFLIVDHGDHYRAKVNATSYESFQYLDLDELVSTEDPGRWDLAFQRHAILMNGGVTGDGGVGALYFESVTFDEIEEAPREGYEEPVQDGPDRDLYHDNVFNGDFDGDEERDGNWWYAYELDGHTLTPRERVYVVRTTEGNAFKFAIDNYYDTAGSPANLQFRFAEIPYAGD